MSLFSKLFNNKTNEDDFDSIISNASQKNEMKPEALSNPIVTPTSAESKNSRIQPKNKTELQKLIKETIEKNGTNCDLNFIDVSRITDMSNLFKSSWLDNIDISKFDGNISSWDVSNVTNMHGMFSSCKFNGDISKWNVSKVTDMSEMFKGVSDPFCPDKNPFNGDISLWDVSNVTNMSEMFYDSQFNGDISNWDVSNVTNMSEMFYDSQFNGDISKWDVSNVSDMTGLFYDSLFNGDISKWNVSKVKKMCASKGIFSSGIFSHSKFNGDISQWDVSNITNMCEMFSHSQFNGDISNWDVSNVTDMDHMFSHSQFHGDIKKWNLTKKWKSGTDITDMFVGSKFTSEEINALFE